MKLFKKLAFLLLITAAAGVCMPVYGQVTPPGKKLYTLYPPLSLTATAIECSVYLTWQKPQTPGGSVPAGLAGYYIFRDGLMIYYINTGETLSYYDDEAEFGNHSYSLTANYDLTSYGSPGQFGTSPPAGPVPVNLNCSIGFPFYEPWDAGTFSFQSWRFIPSQGNWLMNTSQGNPAPTAVFNGSPSSQNYDFTMKGEKLPGRPWVCANMFLEFDYKLSDIAAGGTEKLIAEYYIDTTWHPVAEITNQGSTGWMHQKVDISPVCKKTYRVGFRVTGQNSANIGNWQIDNIRVYPLCKGPANQGYTPNGNIIHLAWEHPPCDSLQAITGYNVYRTDQYGNPPFVKLNTVKLPGFTYTDTIHPTITSGQFKYVITDLQKNLQDNTVLCEAPGDTIVVDYSLGIEVKENPAIRIYPQPAKTKFVISSDSPVESFEMFSILGTSVFKPSSCKQTEVTVPVIKMPNGIYLVQIKNASGTFVRKVTVMH